MKFNDTHYEVSPGLGVFFREVKMEWKEVVGLLQALDHEARQSFTHKADYAGEFSDGATFLEVWDRS